MTNRSRRLGIAGRLAVAQALVAVVVTAIVLAVGWAGTASRIRSDAETSVLGVARSIAVNPLVVEAVQSDDPATALRTYAADTRIATGVAFITIMSPQGVRYTHPIPEEVGRMFVGDIAPAAAGRAFTEEYTGTLGPSVRAVAPIRDGERIVALVAVGVLTASVGRALVGELPTLLGLPAAVLLLSLLVTALLRRYLKRVTGDRHPADLARMVDYDDAILHGLDEGLLLVDRDGRVLHANDRARELLGTEDGEAAELPADVPPVRAGGPPGDDVLLVEGRVLVVSRLPQPGGRTVVLVRDATELRRLSGELQTMRTLSNALRAQAHEHANRLHTIVSLIELGRPADAAELAVETTAAGQRLADALLERVHDPVLVALLLGKSSEAEERGVALEVVTDETARPVVPELRADLVTIVGNLVDNALDAVQEEPAPRRVLVRFTEPSPGVLGIAVEDTGPGIPAERMRHVFDRGYSTKPDGGLGRGIGLALVRAAVSRRGGSIAVEAIEPSGTRMLVRVPGALEAPALPAAVRA